MGLEQLDKVMKSYGLPVGPITLADEVNTRVPGDMTLRFGGGVDGLGDKCRHRRVVSLVVDHGPVVAVVVVDSGGGGGGGSGSGSHLEPVIWDCIDLCRRNSPGEKIQLSRDFDDTR